MPTTLPPRNGDARDDASQVPPSSSLLPDEAALRRAFDAEFPVLVGEASRDLGAAAALAPKVVESAFVHAWEQRTRFASHAGLQAFLRDDVHHGVARALSRRASAHRLGHHGEDETHGAYGANGGARNAPAPSAAATAVAPPPPVDVELAWQHVEHTIHDQGPSHAARAHAVEVSRHDAAQHVAAMAKPRPWLGAAIAGVVGLLAIIAAMLWADRAAQDSAITRALAAPDTRLAGSGQGQMANVTLGDGTRVRLAPDSRVTIPKDFGDRMRAVRLEGGATFEPVTGPERGLQVHAGNAVVVATGTKFTVRAWPGDPAVTVQVESGTVTVRAGDAERTVAAGSAVQVMPDGTMREPDAETVRTTLGWTGGRLVLPQQPLDDVLKQLRRWYGLDVGLADPALGTRPVSLDVPVASPREAIAAIESQARVRYSYAGRDLVFRDSAAAPPTAKK